MRFFLAVILALLSLVAVAPVRAELVDCMTPGYIDSFAVRDLEELTCSEVFRFSFSTPEGSREVRGIADLNADWAFQPDTVGAAESAARQAVAGLDDLGDYLIGDVSILLLSDQFAPESSIDPADPAGATGRDVLATAWDPGLTPTGECRMTMFLWGTGGIVAEFATTVAHELFHCVQYASLSPAQMATLDTGGRWWIEGSAEYYAAATIPDSVGTAGPRGDAFNSSVAELRPINDMGYESTILLYWLHQARGGIGWLMPFLTGMASASGDAAQRGAMRDALTDDEWLDFAEAYVDDMINHPHGQPLGLQGQFPVEYLHVTASSGHTVTLPPFAVIPGMAEYACGKWGNSAEPDPANLATRLDSSSEWSLPWQAEVDTRDNSEPVLRFAAFHTGDAPMDYRLRVRRIATCQPCQGSTEIDRCLVGNWQGDGSPLIDLMARAGAPVSRNAMGEYFLLLNEDGTYVASPSAINVQLLTEDDDGVSTYDLSGVTGGSVGQWSVPGPGRVAGCEGTTDNATARVDYQTPELSGSVGWMGGGSAGHEGVAPYSCDAATMTTTIPMGRFGDVIFTFNRLSPPPEPEGSP